MTRDDDQGRLGSQQQRTCRSVDAAAQPDIPDLHHLTEDCLVFDLHRSCRALTSNELLDEIEPLHRLVAHRHCAGAVGRCTAGRERPVK
jgi:hypothetical protein